MNDAPDLFKTIENVEIKLSRTKTWGGLETDSVYGPADPDRHYAEQIGDPGSYPFTRGAYPQMYRSRMWTLRNIVGYGSPEDTRAGLEMVLAAGGTGISVVPDPLTTQSIDPDHPAFGPEVGLEGCSLPTLRDVERLLEGIDLAKVDTAWHWAAMSYPLVASVHVKRGQPLAALQGSNMPDMLQETLCGWGKQLVPADLGHRTTVDVVEYSVRNSPRWALGMPQAYDLRERGLSPAGEIAVGMAIINKTMEDLIARGLTVDQVAPSLAWVSTSDIDFFEEIAKFRALRRHWARTMKERFGSTDVRSQRLRIACHTSGKSLVYKQPLNNLTRTAIQGLAALCGGVQSLEACTFDEPLCVPTHEARELATRQQQILANEVGAARVADPLGGSYYIEALTDQVENAAVEMLAQIEEIGLIEAITSGELERMMDEYNHDFQRELDSGERIMVGVNQFVPAEEPAPTRFKFDRTNTYNHIRRFSELKQQRDKAAWAASLQTLYGIACAGNNPVQAMIDAFIADASIAEVWGTVRVAHGLDFDPYGQVSAPVAYA
jgi:methylmalonyl-CoA mutase, N-terminal domain